MKPFNIPSVNDLLENPTLKNLSDRLSQSTVTTTVRTVLDEVTQELKTAATDLTVPNIAQLADRIVARVNLDDRSLVTPIVNATGTIFDSGFGPPPMSELTCQAIRRTVSHFTAAGRTGPRDHDTTDSLETIGTATIALEQSVRQRLKQITGAEAALVVTGRRSGTVISLAALAAGREVVISVGQLADLGHDYRVRDLAIAAGITMREVGSVNRTTIDDYQSAITDQTAALLAVQVDNYQLVGQTQSVPVAELAQMLRERRNTDLPLIYDLGPGSLIDLSGHGLKLPLAQDSLHDQADVVVVSGEFITGQSDIAVLLGRTACLAQIEKHPMFDMVRARRIDLAVLESTLETLQDAERATIELPGLQLLTASTENLRNRASRIAPQLSAIDEVESANIVESDVPIGRDMCGTVTTPSISIAIEFCDGCTPEDMQQRLRAGVPAIAATIDRQQRLTLNLRSVLPHQDRLIVDAFRRLLITAEEMQGSD